MHQIVHLGFAVGTGEPVGIPVQHLAVTGQTQMSGKTTTLEALVARSGLRAVAFVTKRHEASFRGEHQRIPPYFRERADWQFVSAVLEATLREKMRFERSWIMRACKDAKTLADVQRNVQRLMFKAKGLSADVYMTLDHYLDVVVPQIAGLDQRVALTLAPGLNVMDLSAYTTELQALVIRSVVEWVYGGSDVLVIIPEAWEFIPQQRASPVLLACEQLIRKGGAGGNFVWLDSQDIAGVHKNVLRSVGVWILGVQREANEVKRTLAHIPGKKPAIDDVMQLERGQFFVCHGRTVIKTYVQPAWMDEATAREVSLGEVAPLAPDRREEAVNEKEARELREDNARLKGEVSRLQVLVQELRDEINVATSPPAVQGGYTAPAGGEPPAPPNTGSGVQPPDIQLAGPIAIEQMYQHIKRRALADGDPKMIALLHRVPAIEVTKTIERVKVDYATQPGILAALIAEGFFTDRTKPASVIVELKRRGRAVHPANVSRDLGNLTSAGFLTRDGDGYQAVPGMKVHILERGMTEAPRGER
jgi:hypothetical protein